MRTAAIFFFACAVSPAAAASLARGPYIESPAAQSAVARWRTDVSTVAWLDYGPKPDCGQYTTISPSAKEHSLPLFGLSPGTKYCYSLWLTAPDGKSSVRVSTGEFTTLRPTEQTDFEFLALGDTGSPDGAQAEIAAQMEKFSPDFVLHLGDLTDFGTDKEADSQFFAPLKNVLAKAPFFIALGNHDYGPRKNYPDGKTFLKKNYLPFHQMPWSQGTPNYYSFDTANARFICLDANEYDNAAWAPELGKNSAQTKWLTEQLSQSAHLWKFVFLHYPLYSSGGKGSTDGLAEVLAPLFEKYRVDAVFSGHEHDYERTWPIKNGVKSDGGVVYVTLGGGGSQLYIQGSQNEWSAKFASVYNFGRGKTTGRKFSFTAYGKDGSVIDSFEIEK